MKVCVTQKNCGCFFLGAACCAILFQVISRPQYRLDAKQELTTKQPTPVLRVAQLPPLLQPLLQTAAPAVAPAAPKMAPSATASTVGSRPRLPLRSVPTVRDYSGLRGSQGRLGSLGASSTEKCQLPAGGRWATVQVSGLQPFQMAVYAGNDIVSSSVSYRHNWEQMDVRRYGKPGHAVDIGGNLGFYTFVLAKAGWNLTTFEAMPSNNALMKATLCANPDLQQRVDLHEVGLGDTPGRCSLMSDTVNVGDGIVVCNTLADPTKNIHAQFAFRTEFEVKRFDEVFPTGKFASSPIDFVKIDVEGFECKVFRGAQQLLTQKPHVIQSEVWGTMQGCTPAEYFKLFTAQGYRVKRDAACSMDADMRHLPVAGQIADYWMCQ